MKRRALAAIVALANIAAAGWSEAAVLLSLTPTVGNLHQLSVGSPVTFFIELSGLPAGAGLDSLFATVEFDGDLLGTPSVAKGAVVPDPLDDPLDFVSQADIGLADAAFVTLGTVASNHIASPGIFYSFQVTPQAAGSDTIDLSFVDASQFNAADPDQPILVGATAGAPLDFTVVPEGVAGDYNGNGTVDIVDYVVWRDNLGSTGSPGIPGDGSGAMIGTPDGVVDDTDYDFWFSRYSAASGSGSDTAASAIPELFSSALLALGGVGLLGGRRRHVQRFATTDSRFSAERK